jgi:hypothetical protein
MNSIALPARLLAGIIAASLLAKAAFAGDASDRTALPACVEQHFTAADAGTMAHLTAMIILESQSDVNDFHAALADKRDAVISDTAKLITRITEQDCKAQVQAVTAVAPPGAVFKFLLQQLSALGMRSLQGPDAQRAGAVLGLDLVKKLDSNVAVDLFGANKQPTAPTSVVPKTTNAPPATAL